MFAIDFFVDHSLVKAKENSTLVAVNDEKKKGFPICGGT